MEIISTIDLHSVVSKPNFDRNQNSERINFFPLEKLLFFIIKNTIHYNNTFTIYISKK